MLALPKGRAVRAPGPVSADMNSLPGFYSSHSLEAEVLWSDN